MVSVVEYSTARGSAVVTERDVEEALKSVPAGSEGQLVILAPDITVEALVRIRQCGAQVITLRFCGDFWTDESHSFISNILASFSGRAAITAIRQAAASRSSNQPPSLTESNSATSGPSSAE